jgi:hypothetical protein
LNKIVFAITLTGLISVLGLSPVAVLGQTGTATGNIEHVWKLVEILDFENTVGWEVQNSDTFWKWDHSYGQGNFSSKIWHKDDKTYIAYGAVASWSAPPEIIKGGEKLSLTVNLSETENTDKWNTSAAATWADFASPALGFSSRGQIPFTNTNGETEISINGANKSSASGNFTATAPAGIPGQRIAIRQIYYMGTSMATYFVYEWQPYQTRKPSRKLSLLQHFPLQRQL